MRKESQPIFLGVSEEIQEEMQEGEKHGRESPYPFEDEPLYPGGGGIQQYWDQQDRGHAEKPELSVRSLHWKQEAGETKGV